MAPDAVKDDNKGRRADSPWQIPAAAWKDVAIRVWDESWADNIGMVAAGVTFYGFLAVVPLLGILVLAYGLIADPSTVIEHMRAMMRILPADVAVLIGQLLMNAVAASENTKGFGFLIALAIALYAGGNGAGAIMTALNIAYQEKEKRSLARFYLIAIAITLVAVLLALVALAATAAVSALDKVTRMADWAVLLGQGASYVLLLAVAAAVAATLYRFGPSREDARWEWITPGSLFTATVWLLLTAGFGFYATRLTDYNAVYGSIAAIVMLLTWMYLSTYVFLFGAELNSELEHQTAKDSTTGVPEPMGRRGAWAADHVAGVTDSADPEEGPNLAEAGPPNPTEEGAAEKERSRS